MILYRYWQLFMYYTGIIVNTQRRNVCKRLMIEYNQHDNMSDNHVPGSKAISANTSFAYSINRKTRVIR